MESGGGCLGHRNKALRNGQMPLLEEPSFPTRELDSFPQEVQGSCGGLNKKASPHRSIGSGTIRKCDLDGAGVALLEEVSH